MNDTIRIWLTRKPVVALINVILGAVIICLHLAGVSDDFSGDLRAVFNVLMGTLYGMFTVYNIWVQLPNFPTLRLILVVAIMTVFFASFSASGTISAFFTISSPIALIGIIGHRDVLERMIVGLTFTMVILAPTAIIFTIVNNLQNTFDPSWYLVAIAVGGIIGFVHWLIYHRSPFDSYEPQAQSPSKNEAFKIITQDTPDEQLFYDDDDEAMSQRQER